MNRKFMIISMVLSFLFSFGIIKVYKAYYNKEINLSFLQIGAYSNYQGAYNAASSFKNHIIYKEGDLYKVFIGATLSDEVYYKLLDMYKDEASVFRKVVNIGGLDIEKKINEYDKAILKTYNREKIDLIINDEFKLLSNYFKDN